MKFSELITKPVISLFESAIEGVVYDAIFSENMKKIKSLLIESAKYDSIEDEYLLEIKDIHKVGKDALMIKNKYALNFFDESSKQNHNPINYNVFTTNGQSLGKINDLELDANFNVLEFYCLSDKFNIDQIASINNNIILINTNEYSVNVSKFKHKTKPIIVKEPINQKAIILPLTQTQNNQTQIFESPYANMPQIIELENKQNEQSSTSIPRLTSQNQNLVGRIITQTIIAQNGELIAKQGNIVTENTIVLASAHQKLRELSFYVK